MRCPICGHTDTAVVDSRPSKLGSYLRRHRRCMECSKKWVTIETILFLYDPAKDLGEVEPKEIKGQLGSRTKQTSIYDKEIPREQ